MRLKVSGKTDIGQKRKINQDSILIDAKLKLFIVADGMGGHKGGEVASKMACESLKEHIKQEIASERPPQSIVDSGFQEATRSVFLEASKPGAEDLHGMGTTMVSCWIFNKVAYIGNVGDSRAYLLSKDGIWRLTEDHSLINEQIRAGIITEEELEAVTGKNVITRSVGFEAEVHVDVFTRKLKVGESLLLCSDGLHGLVTDSWIFKRYQAGSLDSFTDDLVAEANKQGGDDNVSCLFIEVA